MSFIELYGGEWATKSQLSAGDALKFLTLIPKLQLSAKFMAKMGAFGATGKPVKSIITEEGDGVYKAVVEMGDMGCETRLESSNSNMVVKLFKYCHAISFKSLLYTLNL